MGREVRRVPPDWEHPRDEAGRYLPLFDNDFETATAEWKAGLAEWNRGDNPGRAAYPRQDGSFREYWEWAGNPPDRRYYRTRKWDASEATHYQMYNVTSEGMPMSPVMDSLEALAHWLADNKVSTFGLNRPATYEQWLAVCRVGWSSSATMSPEHGLESGVEAIARLEAEKEQANT